MREKVRNLDNRPSASAAGVSLRLLEVFVGTAEAGSMSAAAERLGMTQAAVSQAIVSLEGALKTRLFDRSVRPLALTLAGSKALQHAAEIVARSRAMLDASHTSRGMRMPLLRIGVLNSFATTAGALVLDQIRDLADEWTVESGYRATTLQSLTDRTSDVIVTSDESPAPSGIIALPLFSEPFVIAAPAAYRGRIGDLSQLAEKLDFIRYGRDVHMSGSINRYLESIGARPARRYQFDTTDAALHMVSGGFGWTIVSPLILIKSPAMLDALRIVRLRDPGIERNVRVAMRAGDSAEIAKIVRDAALATLREVVIPRLAALLPSLAGSIRLPEPVEGTRRPTRTTGTPRA